MCVCVRGGLLLSSTYIESIQVHPDECSNTISYKFLLTTKLVFDTSKNKLNISSNTSLVLSTNLLSGNVGAFVRMYLGRLKVSVGKR